MNRDQYLFARATWKRLYAQLTADCRAAKAARAETARAISKLGEMPYVYGTPEAKAYFKEYTVLWKPHSEALARCAELRKQATEMLEDLQALKADAQRSWLAERAEEAVA